MAAVVEPLLMTVEEYRELPQQSDVVQELHWGQVVTLTRPRMRHTKLQYRLVELLRTRLRGEGSRCFRGSVPRPSTIRIARCGRGIRFPGTLGRNGG